jgi:hypothetical protein
LDIVYFNNNFTRELAGDAGVLIEVETLTCTDWDAVGKAMLAGEQIYLRQAKPGEYVWLAENFWIFKATTQTLPI